MHLEGAIQPGVADAYPFAIDSGGPFEIDLRPMTEAMVADVLGERGAGVVAGRFHNTIAVALQAAAERARDETGIDTVALSGGCFANRYLRHRLSRSLAGAGFAVLQHRLVPCNDGGIALGQAVVATARAEAKVSDSAKAT